MSSSKSNSKKSIKDPVSEHLHYLERKYGKEPPISEKELKEWNWH
jgi:hypothetical protein